MYNKNRLYLNEYNLSKKKENKFPHHFFSFIFDFIVLLLPTPTCTYSVQGECCDIDPDCENHDDYLGEFKSMVVMKLRNSIDRDLINDPDCIKGRKKTVQVRFYAFLIIITLLQMRKKNFLLYKLKLAK